jgi:hypothetical protein
MRPLFAGTVLILLGTLAGGRVGIGGDQQEATPMSDNPTTGAKGAKRYWLVVVGTLAAGDSQALSDIRVIADNGRRVPPSPFFSNTDWPPKAYSLPRLEFTDPGFAPGTYELPLRYVAGHRYLVFYGATPYRHLFSAPPKEMSCVDYIRVVDIDEAMSDARLRAMYRAGAGKSKLPRVGKTTDRATLAKWMEDATAKADAGQLTVGDIVEAMGEPNGIKRIEREDAEATEAVYLLATEGLIVRTEVDSNNVTIRYPVVTVRAIGDKVSHLKLENGEREMHSGGLIF